MKNKFRYQIAAFWVFMIFSTLNTGMYGQGFSTSKCNSYTINGLNGDFNVKYKGDIKVADDDKSIKSISQGGYLEIEKKTFGNSRELKIYPNASGQLIYEYSEGISRENFEPNGRKWMEEILPEVIRNSGIDVEGRVDRFYSKSGINGVLNEIKSIESDFVSSKYYRVLISNVKLTNSEYKLAIIAVSKSMSSDFEKSNVLTSVNEFYTSSDELTEAYLTTVSLMNSDFEKSNVLKRLNISNFNEKQQQYYLNTISTINSDFERANVIKYLLDKKSLDSSTFIIAAKVTGEMNSDFEKSNCFKVMLSKSANEKTLAKIFDCVGQMNSDFEKGNVLKIGARNIKPSSSALDAYFGAINSMTSDFEHSGVLKSIIKEYNTDEDLYIRILKSVALMNSDFEKSGVLTYAASRMPKSDKVKEEYIKAANAVNSTFEYGNIMKAIK